MESAPTVDRVPLPNIRTNSVGGGTTTPRRVARNVRTNKERHPPVKGAGTERLRDCKSLEFEKRKRR